MTSPTNPDIPVTAADIAHGRCDRKFPRMYRQATITNHAVQDWADGKTPYGSLLLVGLVGTGKTWNGYAALRAAAVRAYTDAIRRQRAEPSRWYPAHLTPTGAARWEAVSAPDLLAQLRPGAAEAGPEATMARYREASVLLLDDLSTQKDSEWTEEQLFRLINYRYEHELPTILTSNSLLKELAVRLGNRITDRLNQMCEIVILTGNSRRVRG